MKTLTIKRPDDWHLHLRDDDILCAVLPFTANVHGRAIVMPNLKPPVTTVDAAIAYKERIMAALPAGSSFEPLMTCYLTESLQPSEIKRGKKEGVFTAAKLYPAGATTNSEDGVTNIKNIYPVLEAMQEVDIPLLIHGEVTDPEIDVFDRETVYIERELPKILADFPELRVVAEHLTTSVAVDFISAQSSRVGATITPYHLMINRNTMFQGGMRPHMFCMPVPKREEDRQALRKAATSGDSHFFLGTDSAPHLIHRKENHSGAAGIFNSPVAIECLAQVFEEENALDKLESFASTHGPNFYKLPINTDTITLEKSPPSVPDEIDLGGQIGKIKVFSPPEKLEWRLLL
ncbi:MAG: dihydroorotase [Chloroflexota bacterium]